MKRTITFTLFAVSCTLAPAMGQGDPEVVGKIIDEGKNSSQVWEHLEYLSENIGTRLTGSTGLMEANAWTRDMFRSFGLRNARLQKWGEVQVRFDRGPSSARMTKPARLDFEFTTRSWSAGTDGPVSGVVVKRPKTMEDLESLGDELEGAWVLSQPQQRRRRRRRRRLQR